MRRPKDQGGGMRDKTSTIVSALRFPLLLTRRVLLEFVKRQCPLPACTCFGVPIVLSRVADAIYWMSRNVERAENLARFTDVTMNLILDLPPESNEQYSTEQYSTKQWMPLVSITGDHELFAERFGVPTQENVLKFLAFDPEYPNSILRCVQNARENARSIRETISSEMWEHLNQFYYMVMDAAINQQALESPQDFFHEVKTASHLFKGITDGTMTHGEGWHFANLARLIERADKTSRILDVKYFLLLPSVQDVGTQIDDLQWTAVLRSVSGFEMFRKRHHGITPERVVNFLVLDWEFPRAIFHCIDQANESMHAISGTPRGMFRNVAERQLGQLRGELAYGQVSEIISYGLHEYLDSFQTKVNAVGEAIYQTFIALRPEPATAGAS